MNNEYQAYLNSGEWKSAKALASDIFGCHCSACGDKKAIQFHHLYYPADIYQTKAMHLMPLCDDCHKLIHTLPEKPFTYNESRIGSKRQEVLASLRSNGRVISYRCISVRDIENDRLKRVREKHFRFLVEQRRAKRKAAHKKSIIDQRAVV